MARPLKHLIRAATASRRSRFVIVAAILVLSAMAVAVLGGSTRSSSARRLVSRQPAAATSGTAASFQAVRAAAHKLSRRVVVGHSVRNDTSRPLRLMKRGPRSTGHELEPLARPLSHRIAFSRQNARAGGVVQDTPTAPNMPSPSLTFEGMNMASACNCLPPDTDGEAGPSQYVQIVNVAMQVFNKSGTSLLGPIPISTLWGGFGGVCEAQNYGDPIVLYDQLAGRWVISQFNGPGGALPAGAPTDECIAVSATSDATGSYNRYDFHLGSNFFDYPKLGVWPDAYYMSDIVFNAAGTAYLGPQPFAFNRAAMLAGAPASFMTTASPLGSDDPFLPADVDGTAPPPAGAPEPFVEWPGNLTYKVYRFHVDWSSPSSSTFTLAGAPAAAAFSVLCSDRSCVPQPGTAQGLDGIGDRFMARAAYRNYGGHESLVTNYTVASGGVEGIRWIELRNLTSGSPTVAQQSTYQPDSTYRWMGSAGQDASGDMALGFSASSAAVFPSIRWAGRLSSDPANALSQGEATMFAGSGSQTHSAARWGDYSAMVADPTDDCTFWYTQEYYGATSSASWQTRVGKFKFPNCALHTLTVTRAGSGSGTVTSNPAGLSCGSACTFAAGSATSVSLTAAAAAGSTFAGFSGDCAGASCSLGMGANHVVTATFTSAPPPPPPVKKCTVPKVVGLKLAKAKTRIKKAHCRVGKVTKKHSSKKKKGKVIKQSPKAGKKLKVNSKVNLTVGK